MNKDSCYSVNAQFSFVLKRLGDLCKSEYPGREIFIDFQQWA